MTSKYEKLLEILKSNIIDYLIKYGDEHEEYKTATITIQVKTPREFTEKTIGKEIHHTPCKCISNDDFELVIDSLLANKDEVEAIEEVEQEPEEKLTPSETEKCTDKLAKPDYDELCRQVDYLNYQLSVLINENNALRWSLTMSHQEMNDWKNRSETWEENYYREHKRAEKLYDEWAELKERTK